MKLQKDNKYLTSCCILTILIALGILSFGYQTLKGLGATGLREPVAWGIYVVNFTFCLGLGAGILMVLAVIFTNEEISDKFKFILSSAAFIMLSLAGIFIVFDLGRIDRFYYLIIYPHPQSPIFWDFIALHVLLGVSVIFCFITLRQIFLKTGLQERSFCIKKLIYRTVTLKKEFKIDRRLLKKVSFGILLLVIGVYLVTTELFVGLKARPEWNTPFLSVLFLVSSVLCGISLAMLLEGFYSACFAAESNYFSSVKIKKILLRLLVLEMGIAAIKYAIDKNNPLIEKIYSLFPYSFFIFLIIGNIIPILFILAYKKENAVTYRVIPLLIMAGILLKRSDIIIPVYFRRWLPFASDVFYAPTMPEILISVNVYSLGVLAVMGIFYFTRSLIFAKQ